ncbi:hypothetical protein OEZ85_004916 [Tetradesmus obliquus]|uniref:Uncharacterized protein n=1 Tax=Tetradesmus obliquus TaxID=3088 RepID=A0ABY8UK01_TETOB|nr:hypothetical protein OEZ85_004916 [Tetradesmus obliquus]
MLLAHPATAQVYSPRSCRSICRSGTQDVSQPSDAFKNLNFQDNRASQWAGVTLRALREALASPASTLTPPAVAKFLGIYSLAVYQGFALWSPPGRHFLPLTSDILSVPIASQFTVPAGSVSNDPAASLRAQEAAISGAAATFFSLFFQGQLASWSAVQAILATMQANSTADMSSQPAAFQQGQAIATEFYNIFGIANLHNDRKDALPSNLNTPTPQPTPVITDSSPTSLVNGPFTWYPLQIPRSANAFTTGPGALFPPEVFASSTAMPSKVPFLRGYAAVQGPPLLRSVQEGRTQLLKGLDGPPLADKPARFDAAMREVLAVSGQLDDIRKAIAEVWADGPDSTTPPGG